MNKPLIAAFSVLLLLGAGCANLSPGANVQQGEGETAPNSASSLKLDLSNSGLEKVPSSVFSKEGLEELDLSGNQLTGALPSQIQQLQRLRILNASGNAMTGVPAEIGQLSDLQTLDLSKNRLTGLPMELGNLKNLRTLDLRGNNVSKHDLDGIRKELTTTNILVD